MSFLSKELATEIGDTICEILETAEQGRDDPNSPVNRMCLEQGINRSQLLAAAIMGMLRERLDQETQ